MKSILMALKMKIVLGLMLFCAAGIQAQVLVYKRIVHRTEMGNGFTFKSSVSGYLMVDVSTGAAAEFDIDSRTKEFLARTRIFTVGTVHGGPGKEYMVFAEATALTDNFGPYRSSYTAKGKDVPLAIGWDGTRPLPRTMRFTACYVFYLGTEPFIEEHTGTLVMDLVETRSTNAAGSTLDEVVSAHRSKLIASGYRDSHP